MITFSFRLDGGSETGLQTSYEALAGSGSYETFDGHPPTGETPMPRSPDQDTL